MTEEEKWEEEFEEWIEKTYPISNKINPVLKAMTRKAYLQACQKRQEEIEGSKKELNACQRELDRARRLT